MAVLVAAGVTMAAFPDFMQDHLHNPVVLLHSNLTGPHVGKTEGELPAESRIDKPAPRRIPRLPNDTAPEGSRRSVGSSIPFQGGNERTGSPWECDIGSGPQM